MTLNGFFEVQIHFAKLKRIEKLAFVAMVCARRYGMIFQLPYVIIIMLILQINLITLDEEQCCFEFMNFDIYMVTIFCQQILSLNEYKLCSIG